MHKVDELARRGQMQGAIRLREVDEGESTNKSEQCRVAGSKANAVLRAGGGFWAVV